MSPSWERKPLRTRYGLEEWKTHAHISIAYGELYIMARVSNPNVGCVLFVRKFTYVGLNQDRVRKCSEATYNFVGIFARLEAMLSREQQGQNYAAHAEYHRQIAHNLRRVPRSLLPVVDARYSKKCYIRVQQHGGLGR